jgi:hypothetical protein
MIGISLVYIYTNTIKYMHIYIICINNIYILYIHIYICICLYRLIVPQALAGLVHRTKDPDAAAWRFQWSKTRLVADHFLEAMGWVKAYEYHAFWKLGHQAFDLSPSLR